MAGAHTVELTEETFDKEVLQSARPVLVDFWGDRCMPCKALAPTIEELAAEYAGRVKVGKVDVYANPALSVRYEISGVPTVILFRGGEIRERFLGLRSKRDFAAGMGQNLS